MCKIGIVDSGVGGISTLSALLKLLPNEDYFYVRDKSGCPYGERSDAFIMGRLMRICRLLAGLGAKVVVLACNTATNVCIARLRQSMPEGLFVGVEPAVRPAATELVYGKALVLVTPAAARQQKFLSLVRGVDSSVFCEKEGLYGDKKTPAEKWERTGFYIKNSVLSENKPLVFEGDKLIISPQPRLASIVESGINNLTKIRGQIQGELIHLRSRQIESVVLGCTHYCLVADLIGDIFSAKVYDGNIGTAIRLHSLLKARGLISRKSGGVVRFIRV